MSNSVRNASNEPILNTSVDSGMPASSNVSGKIDYSQTIGGSTTRKYLNANVTQVLLEGMRLIAVQKPKDPLRVLGEYLIAHSDQTKENTNNDL